MIQLGEGEVEYHFSIFVLLSALLAYRDYRPLSMGAATAAVHHALFNYLQENDLYGIVCFTHPGFQYGAVARCVRHGTNRHLDFDCAAHGGGCPCRQ
ncbi:hypothetical protein [Candidatus Erwinia dacicola]|uniref:Uncharacterized protein n=1 Tax=Candidatus Erwinia dacicola TaxID=252393 RepID=A0A1E7YZL3_9GAMM|nr:hypothetical protein [Candidatus Erwinia dacicola]OFC61976.1 hypothetical protein BBW68_11260 [Candidatus Erwinia dacicola]